MFCFVSVSNGQVVGNLCFGGHDIHDAYRQFSEFYWRCSNEMNSAIAVFHNSALVGRVLPIMNVHTNEMESFLQELP